MRTEPGGQTLFTRTLSRFFFRQRRAYGKVAAAAHLDVKYFYELVKGTKHNPSRDIVICIGTALKLGLDDMDELLLAAEHAPLVHPRRRKYVHIAEDLFSLEEGTSEM